MEEDGTPAEFGAATTRHGAAALVVITGELDVATAPTLGDIISDSAAGLAADVGRGVVIIDLTSCEFLDSSGCRSLALSARGLPDDVRLVLVCPETNRDVYRVLDFVQLSAALKIYDTAGEVFAEFAVTPPEGLPRP